MPAGSQLLLVATCVVSLLVSRVSDRIDPYFLQIAILIGINITLAVSLNLINGYTGQFSLGHAGFMAVGAYASAVLTTNFGPALLPRVGGQSWILFPVALLAGGMGLVILAFFFTAVRYVLRTSGWDGLFSTPPFYDPQTFSWPLVSTGTSIAVLTYIGFDGISTLAEDVKDPRRTILLATVLTCLVTGVLGGLEVYMGQLVWPDFQNFPERQILQLREVVRHEHAFAGCGQSVHRRRIAFDRRARRRFGDACNLNRDNHDGSVAENDAGIAYHLNPLDAWGKNCT